MTMTVVWFIAITENEIVDRQHEVRADSLVSHAPWAEPVIGNNLSLESLFYEHIIEAIILIFYFENVSGLNMMQIS